MPQFSKASLEKLSTCHPDLRRLMMEAINEIDFSIICGYRCEAEQEKAFKEGKSKRRFPQSRHNKQPSIAVDIVPVPLDWNDIESFENLGAVIMRTAERLDIKIRWGRDFTGLKDYPHFELM